MMSTDAREKAGEVTLKATPIRALGKLMARDLAESQRAEVLSVLEKEYPEYAKKIRSNSILASDRVPLRLVNRMTELIAAERKLPLEQFAKEAGKLGAEEAVGTVLKMLMAFISPQKLLQKAAVTWKSLYDRGELRIHNQSDFSADVELADFPEPSVAGCGRITGWFEWLGGRSGVRNISVRHVECRARGKERCVWAVRWS